MIVFSLLQCFLGKELYWQVDIENLVLMNLPHFLSSICALVVWDFSYVMMVVCCLILLIVPVVLAAGEWKEYGFVVGTGRRLAYKGTN
jgi:hypothetical protein